MSGLGVSASRVAALLLGAYPAAWAETWDRIGLVVGDPEASVTRILATLDADASALQRAHELSADMLLTHHPPFLEDPGHVRGTGASAFAHDAVARSIAVASFHTNLDRAPEGARALGDALGLIDEGPLERASAETGLVTVFVPADHARHVVDAMSRAGAGRIGEYEGCSFETDGSGRFSPREGATPFVGEKGSAVASPETRLEMVCSPVDLPRVVQAAQAAHPYEEPLVLSQVVGMGRGAARLGRVTSLPEASTLLGDVASGVRTSLGAGVRVWGEPSRRISRLATCGGSASSVIGDAIAAGVDALVCGEVRYHSAQESLEAGVAVIEAGHDATEWPIVAILAGRARSLLGGDVEVTEDRPQPRSWTLGGDRDG